MISSLTGTLKFKSPTEVVVEVAGVGYAVTIPLSTYERLGAPNDTVTLLTHLHVREDALQLFGFASNEERSAFRQLISISGIGPKIAQAILSGIAVGELRRYIVSGNSSALTSIPGVGKKTAERLILELKDRVDKSSGYSDTVTSTPSAIDARAEALAALLSLGYNRAAAESAIRKAIVAEGAQPSIEQLIKSALRFI